MPGGKRKPLHGRVGGKGTENEGRLKDLDFSSPRTRAIGRVLDNEARTETQPVLGLPAGKEAGELVASQMENARIASASAEDDGTVIIRGAGDKVVIMNTYKD